MRVPHPIPYQGSKRRIAPQILSFFPSVVQRIVEPFAGSAAISIAAAIDGRAKTFWINDFHQPLIGLWREIIERPEAIAQGYRELWNAQVGNERKFYDDVRTRFNRSQNPSDFLYLLARCVKAAVRYNKIGEFNNSPDNRRKGAKPEEMSWRIDATARLLNGRTLLTTLDYTEVLTQCQREDLIYMDPPYQGVSGTRDHRYYGGVDYEEFVESLSNLLKRNMLFAVSYDGRTGEKTHGRLLTETLDLIHVEVLAGTSTQSTLLGSPQDTVESLYISPALYAQRDRNGFSFASRGYC